MLNTRAMVALVVAFMLAVSVAASISELQLQGALDRRHARPCDRTPIDHPGRYAPGSWREGASRAIDRQG